MNCPNCGKEIKEKQKFCTNCGYKIELSSNNFQDTKNQDNSKQTIITVVSSVFGVSLLIALIFGILNYFGTEASNTLNKNNSNYIPFENKAQNCEAETVKDLAIQIFKENNKYYKAIDESSIKSVELIYPAVNSYDSTIDKYECSAQIIMKSTSSGFLPEEYDFRNDYYDYAHDSWGTSDLAKYTKYKVNISYSSQISEGRTLVSSSETSEKFSCDENNCERIIDKKYDKPKEIVQPSYNNTSYQEKKEIKPAPKPTIKEENKVSQPATIPVQNSNNIYNQNPKKETNTNYNKEAEDELF